MGGARKGPIDTIAEKLTDAIYYPLNNPRAKVEPWTNPEGWTKPEAPPKQTAVDEVEKAEQESKSPLDKTLDEIKEEEDEEGSSQKEKKGSAKSKTKKEA